VPRRVRDEAVVLKRRRGSRRQRAQLDGLLAVSAGSQLARSQLRAMLLARKMRQEVWSGVAYCPAGSFLETAIAAFQHGTDIPLELPFFAATSMVSAHLLDNGAVIDLRGQVFRPALWTILLAPSGAGKTFTTSRLLQLTGAGLRAFPDPASAARFVEDLQQHNHAFWMRDEIGQFLRNVEQQTHLQEMRDYLLRLYDGTTISRNIKGHSISVPDPALCVLGMTVDETWGECVPAAAMLDGFAQRFNFALARPRPKEEMKPLYDLSHWTARLREQWQAIEQVPVQPVYAVGGAAVAAYEEAFVRLRAEAGDRLPASYLRRALFSIFRYALVYHLVELKTGPELDARDIGWAARVVRHHLIDTASILDAYGMSDLARKIDRVEELLTKARRIGEPLTAREVARRVHGVVHAQEARALLELALEGDEAATEEERAVAAGARRTRARADRTVVPFKAAA
jgi:Protein of unknown function (DUF3987)